MLYFERDTFASEDIKSMYKCIAKEFWTKWMPITADSVKMGFNLLEREKAELDF